ncbi:MAG: hypothetical protein KBA75_01400 [Alphaproteobacteria bacterium]|nr:hypothetical protein [Alphaproteobacteria bacterium]
MRAYSFVDLQNLADIIVIATPTATTELTEHTPPPNIRTVDKAGKEMPVMGTGLNTHFQIISVRKGEANLKEFTLHHFRLTVVGPQVNGPGLLSFKAEDRAPWLL